jgi:hypothetical protein
MERLIEKTAEYNGYKFEVVLTEAGHRCGYVYVPLPGAEYLDLEVHGGITYSDFECIGFDCAHYGDSPDIEAVRTAWGDSVADSCKVFTSDGVVWTSEMVENECKSLIDQLIKMFKGPDDVGPIKIVRAEKEILVFSDGTTITSCHCQDCCEYNYADFSAIDDLAREWEFRHPLTFEASNYGFRFGNKDKMVFVPCYSEQNGYYSYSVEIYYNGAPVFYDLECRDAYDY